MSVNNIDSSQILDLDILTQYTQAIGGQVLLGSVDLFAQEYPKYVATLVGHHDDGDLEAVAAQAHKMKGAAGAIGLARLGQWAQLIQHREQEGWLQQYPQVIALISQHYQSDIAQLRKYLESC